MRPVSTFTVVALLAIVLAGCAKAPARTASAIEGRRTPEAAALEARLLAWREATPSLKGLAHVELVTPEEDRRTEAAIVVLRPNRIRIDAMDALADVWAQAGSDGETLWLYLPGRRKLYEGRSTPRTFRKLAGFEGDPAELVSIIAGLPPLGASPELLQVGGSRDGHFVDRATGLHLWTEVGKKRVARCARIGADGEMPDYEADFTDYRREGGVEFPHRIDARFPGHEARIVVEYRDLRLGGAVDDASFRSPSGRGGTRVKVRDE